MGSPYRELAEVPPDPPVRRPPPRRDTSGFTLVVLLWLSVLGMAVLNEALR